MTITNRFLSAMNKAQEGWDIARDNLFGLPVRSVSPMDKSYPTTLEIGMSGVGVPAFDDRMDTLNLRIPRQFLTLKQIDALFSASDVGQTILRTLEDEIFRNGFDIEELFQFKCRDCGKTFDDERHTCDECKGIIKTPNWQERKKLLQWMPRADVNSSVNRFNQNLKHVTKQCERDLNKYDNAYIFLQKGYVFNTDGNLVANPVKEIYRASPFWMRKMFSSHGLSRNDKGEWIYVCVNHRLNIHEKKLEGHYRCPECDREMFKVEFAAKQKMGEEREIYYVRGEVYHLIKYEPNPGYGVSRMFVIWVKLLTLYQMDKYIWKMFSLQRSPRGLLFLRGKLEHVEKSWLWMRNMARQNPNMVYPIAVDPVVGGSDKTGNLAQYVDLSIDLSLLQFIEMRQEFRTSIGMVFGVEPVFQGDLSTGGGLNNEGLQVTVTNRAMQEAQNVWNEFFIWFSYQLGVDDLTIILNPSEEKDEKAKEEQVGLRLRNAKEAQALGYDIDLYEADDGLNFHLGEKDPSLRQTSTDMGGFGGGGFPGQGGGGAFGDSSRLQGDPSESGSTQAINQGFEGMPDISKSRNMNKSWNVPIGEPLGEHTEEIKEFFTKTPPKSDEDVHKFAETLGVKPDELEGEIYDILSSMMNIVKSNDENGELLERTAQAIYGKPFPGLNDSEKNHVYEVLMKRDPSLRGVTYGFNKELDTAPPHSNVAGQEYEGDPTDSQKKTGKYEKPRLKYNDDSVVIENPVLSVRSGTGYGGKKWETRMAADYGYILGTVGADKDHLDVFIKPGSDGSQGKVYVIDQVNPKTGAFDEHKIMFGYNSQDDAIFGYQANYEWDWGGLGAITELSPEEWKKWKSKKANLKKPMALQDIQKEKKYVTDPGDAPEGVSIQEGPRGGHYYEGAGKTPKTPTQEEPAIPLQAPEDMADTGFDKLKESLIRGGITKPTDLIYSDRPRFFSYYKDMSKEDQITAKLNAYTTLKNMDKEDFVGALKTFKTSWTLDAPSDEIQKNKQIAWFLGNLGADIRYASRAKEIGVPGAEAFDKEGFIEEIRNDLDNDTKLINSILKYMGFKERVKKSGLRGTPQTKTAEEISNSLKSTEVNGITYKISPTYIKNSKVFKNQEQLEKSFKDVVDNLPPKAKESITKGETKVHFITRPEAKKISRALSSNRDLGYYIPSTKQIFIFPDKAATFTTNLDPDTMKSYGYDDEFINKLKKKEGAESWKNVVTHELAHATALNNKNNYQEQWNAEISTLIKPWSGKVAREEMKDAYISNYAMTNNTEDFAETAAFYARDKGFVDKELEKGDKSFIHPMLRKKFEFLRDKIWT